jgi:hypothetical protein
VASIEGALLARLDDPAPALRSDALAELEKLLPGLEVAPCLARAAALVADPECGDAAISFLRACAAAGKRLAPVLEQVAAASTPENCASLAALFLACEPQGEFSAGMLGVALDALADPRSEWVATELVETLAKRGADLGGAVPRLLAYLAAASGASSYTESVIGVLLRHFLARGDVGAAASLLAHPQRAHRVSALYNLGVLQKGGADLRPLLPALEAAASDPSDEVRGRAAKLVAAIGAR